jgi:hypothetical protein
MTDSAISHVPVAHFAPRQQRRDATDARATVAAPRSPAHAKAEFARYRPRWWASITPLTFSIIIIIVLAIGWLNRDDGGLTPESGLGYWLGIVGASLMLLLLLYPLRKRVRALRALGSVAFWFRTHMILGIVGPVLILLHANFRFGSINSNVALVAMLIVAVSGIVGRYLYGKIHLGLYGRKAQVKEILADVDALEELIGSDLPLADHVVARLNTLAQLGTNSPRGVLAGLLRLPVISMHAHVVRARLIVDARQIIKVEGKRLGWSRRVRRQRLAGVVDLVTLHVAAVKKAAAFAFYERLFGLWHVFHLPLFFLLVTAAIIHVFAAHFF